MARTASAARSPAKSRDWRDGRASRGYAVPVCRDNAHRGPRQSAGGRGEAGLAGPLPVVGAWVPPPPSATVNTTSITRRRAEQAGRLGDPDKTALRGRLPRVLASAVAATGIMSGLLAHGALPGLATVILPRLG